MISMIVNDFDRFRSEQKAPAGMLTICFEVKKKMHSGGGQPFLELHLEGGGQPHLEVELHSVQKVTSPP